MKQMRIFPFKHGVSIISLFSILNNLKGMEWKDGRVSSELARENNEDQQLLNYEQLFSYWLDQSKIASLDANNKTSHTDSTRVAPVPAIGWAALSMLKQVKNKPRLTDAELNKANEIVSKMSAKRTFQEMQDSSSINAQPQIKEHKKDNEAFENRSSPCYTNLVCNNCGFQTDQLFEMRKHIIKDLLKPNLTEIIMREIISNDYYCRFKSCLHSFGTPSQRATHEKGHLTFMN